jgi:hypothetical protein
MQLEAALDEMDPRGLQSSCAVAVPLKPSAVLHITPESHQSAQLCNRQCDSISV